MKKNLLLLSVVLLQLATNAQPWQTKTDVPVDLAFPIVVELRGDIHVIGGGAPGGASNLHLRYSPATDDWDTLAAIPYLAQQAAGAVVNGKIHVCGGGYPTSGQRLDTHYYYDVDSDAWFPAAAMPMAVAIHKCVEADNKLYVLSGQPDKTLCEFYDPVTDTWTQRNPLPDMDFWYGGIQSANNTIYRFGGGAYFSPTKAANVYDVANDTWLGLPAFPVFVHAPATANIGDSLIWIFGGYANGAEIDSAWIYNISAQTYTATDQLPVARSYHSGVTVNGCVYSVGGNNNNVPQVSVSLLQNCTPLYTGIVQQTKNEDAKPYLIIRTNSLLQLQLNTESLTKPAAIKLIDITGRTILTQSFNKNNGSITISNQNLSAGMYIVLIAIGNQTFTEQWMAGK